MKPTVRYIPTPANFIEAGKRAHIVPIDHPDPNQQIDNGYPVWTSMVIFIDYETGNFETLNTKYVPDAQFASR